MVWYGMVPYRELFQLHSFIHSFIQPPSSCSPQWAQSRDAVTARRDGIGGGGV